ncbi:MAG: 5-(carboxyamino)imidazole ribonucleotide mutase [Vallitaleaceae bacterium]|jgi:5-(carboxyamino)imidazole ribonucleotide mutase|nr:5-(carboxyamino)imidazole ribonucleotide mutase [Vallitaleaceae bacterium]
MKVQVGIIMGSDSDLPIMAETAKILDQLEVGYELTVISAHRTPERAVTYAREARRNGLKVIIAGAGGAAHLAGVIAALTTLPVIGVPILTKSLGGADALYSIVQMPPGIPVATVAINGAKNAGILAAQIIGCYDSVIENNLDIFKESMRAVVDNKAEKLEAKGYKAYLKEDMA